MSKIVEHYLPEIDGTIVNQWAVSLPPFSQVRSVDWLNGKLTVFVEVDELTGGMETHQLVAFTSDMPVSLGINARFLGTIIVGLVAFHVYYLGKET